MTTFTRRTIVTILFILAALAECWFVSLAVDLLTQGSYLMSMALLCALIWGSIEMANGLVAILFLERKY